MPRKKAGTHPFTVTLSTDEHDVLVRLAKAYKGMSVDGIARIFIAFAIPRAVEAMGLPAAEVLKELTSLPALSDEGKV